MALAKGNNAVQSLKTERDATIDELEKYKLLVESIQDYAIFLMDDKGNIKTWNKGAEKNKGYKAHEIIGQHFSKFYLQEDIDARKPEKELEIAVKFGRAEDEDWRVRKDGSKFWASVVITTLHGTDGKIVGFAKVTRDLTERKKHEDELRKANSMLKAQQRDLELLNLSKDEFISLASHQLRTPASAIKQLLGMFVEGFRTDISDDDLQLIKKAYDSNERQIEIVNSLLKVAQVDAGKVVLRLGSVSVSNLLEEIVNEFADGIRTKKQTFILEPVDSGIRLTADIGHLRMALENIISNASKYTHSDGKIVVSAVKHGKEAVIAVSDNGVGIADKDIGILFSKFTRIQNELSDQAGGSGLGLYWAHRVIALHCGRIVVDSAPGQGSTFRVCLPLEDESA